MISPAFLPLGQAATYEATFGVENAPVLDFRNRARTAARPQARLQLAPERVTVCYSYRDGRWYPSGIEIVGPEPEEDGTLLVARFTPHPVRSTEWVEDPPQWATNLIDLMTPTQAPG